MKRINAETTADLYLKIQWSSDIVRHTETYAAADVNFWRDLLPGSLKDTLMGKACGDQVRLNLAADELIQPSDLRTVRRTQFDGTRLSPFPPQPRMGRFYPQGVLKDMPNIFRANRQPLRVVAAGNGDLTIDLGHPLSGRSIALSATVGTVRSKFTERGGGLRDWGAIATQGVGMQARWKQVPSDFFTGTPFARKDEQPDDQFYTRPRLVPHIDTTASNMVSRIYSRFISNRLRVLDLMSSWQSHWPADIQLSRSTGLGLNPVELTQNEQLTDFIVLDLNRTPRLPFGPDSFDMTVCTLSVEYLTTPIVIFQEVARVLRPGGWFVVTFSNRWFETKTIRIWPELHEYERMGLVLEYFRQSKRFTDLETYAIRGLERPAGDKYYGRLAYADPVYAVWGRTLA